MGDQPARRFYCEMRRRNEFDCWGLELAGGWAEGQTWCEVSYVRWVTVTVVMWSTAGENRGF